MDSDSESQYTTKKSPMKFLFIGTILLFLFQGINIWLLSEPSIILTESLTRYRKVLCSSYVQIAANRPEELSLIGEIEINQRMEKCRESRMNYEELFFEHCRTNAQENLIWIVPISQIFVTLLSFFYLLNKVSFVTVVFF